MKEINLFGLARVEDECKTQKRFVHDVDDEYHFVLVYIKRCQIIRIIKFDSYERSLMHISMKQMFGHCMFQW